MKFFTLHDMHRAATAVWWLAPLPQNKEGPGFKSNSQVGLFCVQYACSTPYVPVDFLLGALASFQSPDKCNKWL